MRPNLAFLVVATLAVVTPSLNAGDTADALVVLEGSAEVRFSKVEDTSQVKYSVRAKYPADELVSQLNSVLVKRGWSLMSESFLNPGTRSSLTRGWVEYLDSAGTKKRIVYRWSAHWTNRRSKVVQFTLKYSCPLSTTGESGSTSDCLERVRVHGVFFDEDAADRQRQTLRASSSGSSNGNGI